MEELNQEQTNSYVIAVFPNKVRIVIEDLNKFREVDQTLRVGSYLRIEDSDNASMIALIENFQIFT
jgi:hypothetical protein